MAQKKYNYTVIGNKRQESHAYYESLAIRWEKKLKIEIEGYNEHI